MDKVQNTDYLKDNQTGNVVNSNQRDYNIARARVSKQKMKDKKITDLQNEISEMKSDMNKILTLLEKSK